MAKKVQIIQFDSDDNYFTVVDLICFNMGFDLVACANNLDQATRIFKDIEQKKLQPDIAIVSNHLARDHGDGKHVYQKLKDIAPAIKIIAYTVDEETDWGDKVAFKSNRDESKSIIKILQDLTKADFKFDNAS